MTKSTLNKLSNLKRILHKYPGVIVAFSGGVDSSLLLKVAKDVLKKKVIAVTAVSALYPKTETEAAMRIARQLKIRHIKIPSREMKTPVFVKNPRNRCFHCKIELFKVLKTIGRRYGYEVIEASNKSDLSDYRPGLLAVKRLGVRSPLIKAGLTKEEIRQLSRRFKLPTWNKPSMACLASRIPYGHMIDKKTIKRIERAEKYLKNMGLNQVRVRDHYPVARIEVLENETRMILRQRKKIVQYLMVLGYKYVALDLEGYQTGSMNR